MNHPPPVYGFTDYRIDWVVKFGGSILADLSVASRMIAAICELSREGHRLLVLPGGGPTDKTIESIDKHVGFNMEIAHQACALAQDQTGLMICDPFFSSQLAPCRTLTEARQMLDTGKVPVLLPSLLIQVVDPIQRTWDVTSDAVAGWLAWLVGAANLVVLTDVDGIFEPTKIGESQALYHEIDAALAAELGLTSIDKCLAAFLVAKQFNCHVMNAWFPDRLKAVVRGQPGLGTKVVGVRGGAKDA